MDDVAAWPLEKRLDVVWTKTKPRLGPDVLKQVAAMVSPESLKIMAGVLIAWVVSHAFGFGEIIDIVIAAGGVLCIGLAVFSGLDELYAFATGVYYARTSADLDAAAEHLAKAIAILGITAVMAVLFRGRPKTYEGGRINVSQIEPPPPRTSGWFYRPTTTLDASLPAGRGSTTPWGDIRISTQGSALEQALAWWHEWIHSLLRPRLYLLREFRVDNWAQSYFRSSLWRYLEEALAETGAQVGTCQFQNAFVGIVFPVRNGYVYLFRGGGYKALMGGSGVIPEGLALLMTGPMAGIDLQLWFGPESARATQPVTPPFFPNRR